MTVVDARREVTYVPQAGGRWTKVEFGRHFLDEISTIGLLSVSLPFLSSSFVFTHEISFRAIKKKKKKRSNRDLREIPITSLVRYQEFLPSAETAANFAPDERPLSIFGESCPVARRRISEGISPVFRTIGYFRGLHRVTSITADHG